MVRALEEEKEIPSAESQKVNGLKLLRKETIRSRNKADDSGSAIINQNQPSGMSSSSAFQVLTISRENFSLVENVYHIFRLFVQWLNTNIFRSFG